jgi:hypothetical protein
MGGLQKSDRFRRQKQREYEFARNIILSALQARGQGHLLDRIDPITTAVHESAHCVFSEAFGITVSWATCLPAIYNGESELGHMHSNADKVILPGILHITQGLAGDLAERPLITNDPFSPETAFISGTDLLTLEDHLRDSGFQKSEYMDAYLRMALTCLNLIELSQHWIDAVAVLLYSKKTAQGEEIRKVLRAKGFYVADNPLILFSARVWQAAKYANNMQFANGNLYTGVRNDNSARTAE